MQVLACQLFAVAPDISDTYNPARMAGFGSRIKALREGLEWSQEELATKARVSRDTVYRAEQSDNVRVNSLYQIAAALEVPVSALFGERTKAVVPRRDREAARLLGTLSDEQYEYVLKLVRGFAHEAEGKADE